jgi:hypothetical protein
MSPNATVRAGMVPITRRVRGYFAALNRETAAPVIFDPAKNGLFDLEEPPAPWISLGWIDNFRRSSGIKTETIRSGVQSSSATQFRTVTDATVELDFREWGTLQMALASGSQHMNVLAVQPSADPQPAGGNPFPAMAVLPASTATEVVFGAGAVDFWAAGDILAIDLDYQQQVGNVGTGIAAAYVKDPADVQHDVNYVRRVTFNVGRIAQKTATSVLLAQPLLGGVPATGAGAQKVVAFVDREGGGFFQQWSALFVEEQESGGRVCFYYPRLSPGSSKASSGNNATGTDRFPETMIEVGGALEATALHASFVARPENDAIDGEPVACYRSYFPAQLAALY